MFSAVIYTTGRTGSQLIGKNLAAYFQVPFFYDHQNVNITNGVVHAHNPLWQPPTDDFICILSKRKNIFNSIISTLVGNITNEHTDYSNQTIAPTVIDELDFTHCYWFTRTYYNVIDTTKFKKIIEVYFENIVADPKHLFSLLDIDYDTQYSLSEKSPYKYTDIVTNFSELKNLFDNLEKLPLTDELIRTTKESISIDLTNIRTSESPTLQA
jgi:hypothetical protein